MHEMFMIAEVADDEFMKTVKILQGYCGMQPVTLIRRRLFWEGPKVRQPKGFDRRFLQSIPPEKRPQWIQLHEQLLRQSYHLRLLYVVPRDQFGKVNSEGVVEDGPEMDCDKTPGTLRWTDIPEPGKEVDANKRPIITIDNETRLCSILSDQHHRFTTEIIEDCRRYVKGNVLLELFRYLRLPPKEDEILPTVRKKLPPFDSLEPYDGDNKWILSASVLMINGNDPKVSKQALAELTQIKKDLEGIFKAGDFGPRDRHVFDTRVKI